MVAPTNDNRTRPGSKTEVNLLSSFLRRPSLKIQTLKRQNAEAQPLECSTDCPHCKEATIRVKSINDTQRGGNTFIVNTNFYDKVN